MLGLLVEGFVVAGFEHFPGGVASASEKCGDEVRGSKGGSVVVAGFTVEEFAVLSANVLSFVEGFGRVVTDVGAHWLEVEGTEFEYNVLFLLDVGKVPVGNDKEVSDTFGSF